MENILIAGAWRPADAKGSFRAINPDSGDTLEQEYPVSSRSDLDAALAAGTEASRQLKSAAREEVAGFLEGYANRIDERKQKSTNLWSNKGFP